MTLSESLTQPTTLVSMTLVLKDLPLENITFVQYPAGASANNPNRVVPRVELAEELFEKIRADQPFALEASTGIGTVVDPAAPQPTEPPLPDPSLSPETHGASPPVPPVDVIEGVTGQTAADRTCSRSNN